MQGFNLMPLLKRIAKHPLFLMILGFAVIVLSAIAAGFVGSRVLAPLGKSGAEELALGILAAVFAVMAYLAFGRWIECRKVDDLSMERAFPEWGFGVAVGAGAMAITIGVIALFGGYKVIGQNGIAVLLPIAGIAFQSGFFEEILLRGIVFRLMEKWLGSWVALGFSALLFGALHLANPNASLLAAFAIAIEAGILLGAIYMLTRRLWAAIGLHMAWNFTQGGIFGVAVSGFETPGVLKPVMDGSDLLTGGGFGAEASLPAIIICTTIGLFFLYRAHAQGSVVSPSWHRFKTGEEAPAVNQV
jgi:membrane protease YdiL (CAAX protease family)